MTERLSDINARIEGIRQLGVVVNAMRGIAAARAQQARGQLGAADAYAATIAAAIGRALALLADARPDGDHSATRPALVLFAAEQGFAGAFSEHVLDAAGGDLSTGALFMIGTRGVAIADERGIAPDWHTAMPSHSLGVPRLAERVADALYGRIATGEIDRIDVIFSRLRAGHGIAAERLRLLPLDMSVFRLHGNLAAPLVNLAPDALVRELAASYLHAQLCHAALHAFVAENEARMATMESARDQIERQLASLQATQRRVRQEEITAEIVELAAGEVASRTDEP